MENNWKEIIVAMRRLGEAIKGIKISRAEIFLLLTLFIFGGIMIMMTPLGAGYDEDHHLYRVWQLSNLKMLPGEQGWREAKYPNVYYELSYRKQALVESVGFGYWKEYGRLKLYDHGYYYRPIDPRSRYPPPLLLPQALALRYSRGRFDLPALPIYYITRFAGLFAYIILTWLAVRLIPFGKWLLAILAVAPMAVYQASTISADTITNGIGFLFIGGTLFITNKNQIKRKEVLMLLFLFAILFLSKPNIFPLVLLPFLIIPPSKFSNRAIYPLLILCALILFGIEFVGWNMVSPIKGFTPSGQVNAVEQLNYILSNPLSFPAVIIKDLRTMGAVYLTQWIGVYGYDYGSVPTLTYILFIVGTFLALFLRDEYRPNQRTRLSLLLVFFLCYLVILLSLYITYTAVRELFVYGIQGRYFIPVFPLLFLALYNVPHAWRFHSSILCVSLLSLASLTIFTVGLVLTYHVTCGSSYYSFGLCYQPFYKNLSPLTASSPPLSKHVLLEQEIVPVCDGMTEIQVRVNSAGTAGPNGSIEFTLSDLKNNTALFQHKVDNSDLPKDAWYGIQFEPEQNSAGRMYLLSIAGAGESSTDGPLLAYSIKPEYPLGRMFENGRPSEDDVIFRYGCLVGIEKILSDIKP